MDDPSHPTSPMSQLLHNLGMTRDDLTRHSDQMRQFLTAENSNSFRAFAMVESDTDSVKSPTPLPQTLRAKSRSISAADAPSLPPATPIKTEPVEPTASSSLRRFESMDEIIERQNRRSKRERRSRRDRDTSPTLPHSPTTRSSLRASGHARTRDSGRVKTTDDSLPSNLDPSQVSNCKILLCRLAYFALHRILYRNLLRPVEPAAIIETPSCIRQLHPSTVALLV
jgi:hypothetical protein